MYFVCIVRSFWLQLSTLFSNFSMLNIGFQVVDGFSSLIIIDPQTLSISVCYIACWKTQIFDHSLSKVATEPNIAAIWIAPVDGIRALGVDPTSLFQPIPRLGPEEVHGSTTGIRSY